MTKDLWNGNGDWNHNPGDWNLGVPPTASERAEIQTGTCTVSTRGSAKTLTIDSNAELNLDSLDGATLTLTDWLDNEHFVNLQDGATLTMGRSFINHNSFYVDFYGDGGSEATIDGTLINDGVVAIGNTALSAPTTVKAASLVNNNGTIEVMGNTASGTTDKASLVIAGVAPSTFSGQVALVVVGDATVKFGSGEITEIGPPPTGASGPLFELDGAGAKILTKGGASALSKLATNDGTLVLGGFFGPGGATLTTTTSFTNNLTVEIDSNVNGDSGSHATFGGALTNNGTFDIGNAALSAATTVTAESLDNTGTLALVGSGSALAELVVNGAATTTGDITIGGGSEIDVTGSHKFVQTGGSTTVTGALVARTIETNGGLLDFTEAITSGDGVGALDIGAKGTLKFGSSVDSSHFVDFTAASGRLNLGDAGQFKGTIKGFSGAADIDLLGHTISGLSYSGSSAAGLLTVTGAGGTIAELAFSGDYTRRNFAFSGDQISFVSSPMGQVAGFMFS